MKATTLKHIINMMKVTSKDRYNLAFVKVSRVLDATNMVQLTACNGISLAEMAVEDESLYEVLKNAEDYSVMQHDLKYLKAIYADNKKASIIHIKDIESGALLDNKVRIESLSSQNITYPNIEAVKREKGEGDIEIALDASLLLDLANALSDSKKAIVRLSINDNATPFIVSTNIGSGLLMPCRF